MRYFSTSVITSPCLFSLMGVFLQTIGNGTAVGAMEHHVQPQAIERPQQSGLPLGQFIELYITDLDLHTQALTPQSAVFLGNNPDDYARSGLIFRRRDPHNHLPMRRQVIQNYEIESNNPHADDPHINDPQPTSFRQVGLLRQLTSSEDANTLLHNIERKQLPTNTLYCAAVLTEIIYGYYLLSLSDDWLPMFHQQVILPNMNILSVHLATIPRRVLPPPYPLLGLPSPYSNTEHPDA
ncbi:hypothetical protein FB446DRAFT_352294 [Lentinula raphanica]|nr:hypothetical protein C8R42DRAFT_368159 [Lentinula raphanica]KAJ3767107.1 hypothetical protein FB446DRAFT_352294 [Lentinula raphanica]